MTLIEAERRVELLTFVTGEDGVVRVQSWPDVIEVSKHFLNDPPSQLKGWHLEVAADEIRFDIPNGSARYRRIGEVSGYPITVYQKLTSSLEF